MQRQFLLFIDGSVNPRSKIGFGCYLLLPDKLLRQLTPAEIAANLKVKRFAATSSSRLEIETVLWALKETEKIIGNENELLIYTDSLNLAGLLNRRKSLEKGNFQSCQRKTELKNADVYRQFYHFMDRLKIKVIKVTGHSKLGDKNTVDKIFLQVDRSARKALRKYIEFRQSD